MLGHVRILTLPAPGAPRRASVPCEHAAPNSEHLMVPVRGLQEHWTRGPHSSFPTPPPWKG